MGVENTTYDIPDLVLSDTFHEWFTVTNNSIIEKLNRLEVYTVQSAGGSAGDGISASTNAAGVLHIEIGNTVEKDITFNGSITVNGKTTTINSTEFTVDDYNLVLGSTTESVNDHDIMLQSGGASGGGIIVKGVSGDKEFLWKHTNAGWNSNQNISIGSNKSLLGASDSATGITGDPFRLDRTGGIKFGTGVSGGSGNAPKGLILGFAVGTTGNGATMSPLLSGGFTGITIGGSTGTNRLFRVFNDDIVAGHSADAMYIDDDGYVSIVNGANKITIDQSSHGFTFGTPVYMTPSSGYAAAKANAVATAEVIGVVSRVYNSSKFELTLGGELRGNFSGISDESSNLTPGNAYFLSPLNAGQITEEKPVSNGQVQKTVFIALDADRALVKNYLGGEVELIQNAANGLRANTILFNDTIAEGFTFGDAAIVKQDASGGMVFKRAKANADMSDVVGIVNDIDVGGIENMNSLVMSGSFTMRDCNVNTVGETYFIHPSPPAADVRSNTISGKELDDGIDVVTGSAVAFAADQINKPLYVADGVSGGIVTILRGTVEEPIAEDDFSTDVPVGSVMAWSGSVAAIPQGFVLCDGAAYAETLYPELFTEIGRKFGGDESANTFTVPNLKGKFIVGRDPDDADFDTIGDFGGSKKHTLTVDELPDHDHAYESAVHPRSSQTAGEIAAGNIISGTGHDNAEQEQEGDPQGGAAGRTQFGVAKVTKPTSLVSSFLGEGIGSGSGIAHDNLPPFFTLAYIIRVEGVNELFDGTQILGGDSEFISITNYDIGGGELLVQHPDLSYDPLGWIDLGTNPGSNSGEGGQSSKGGGAAGGWVYDVHTTFMRDITYFETSAGFPDYRRGRGNAQTKEWTLNVADLRGNGFNAALVRSAKLAIEFDDDFFFHYVEYLDPNTGQYIPIAGDNRQGSGPPAILTSGLSDRAGQFYATTVTVPVVPNQSQLQFRMRIWLNQTPNVEPGLQYDQISMTLLGVNQVMDNALTRLKQTNTDRKNLIVNGNFDLWQRRRAIGTTVDAKQDDDAYFADRWLRSQKLSSGGKSTLAVQRKEFGLAQTEVPHYPKYYINVKGNETGTFDSDGHNYIGQKIENVRTLSGKNATISFWAKGDATGTCFLGYSRDYGTNGVPATNENFGVRSFIVDTTWRRYTFSIRIADLTSGTEGKDTCNTPDSSLDINLYTCLKAGIRGNGSANINYTGTLSLAQVQVEEGSKATDFELLREDETLRLCQRYYSTSFNARENEAESLVNARGYVPVINHLVNSVLQQHTTFPVPMRTEPYVDVLNRSNDGFGTIGSPEASGISGKIHLKRAFSNAQRQANEMLIPDHSNKTLGVSRIGGNRQVGGLNGFARGTKEYINEIFVIDETVGDQYWQCEFHYNFKADAELYNNS